MPDLAPEYERAIKEAVIARLDPSLARGLADKSDAYVGALYDSTLNYLARRSELGLDARQAVN